MAKPIGAIKGSETGNTRKILEARSKQIATVQARDESLFTGKTQPSANSPSLFSDTKA